MRVTNTDPEDLRRYLLGQLPEEEAERMEARLLEDDEVSALAEEELLIEHFRGELPEGRDLVSRLSASEAGRRRVADAQALVQAIALAEKAKTPAEPTPPAEAEPKPASEVRPFRERPAVRAALAGSLAAALLVGIGLGLRVRTPVPPSPGHPVVTSTRSTRVEPLPALFILALSGVRSGGGTLPRLDLAPEKTRIELKLPLEGETFPSYQVSLTREDGSQVPHAVKTDVPGFLVVPVRAADLPDGVYGVKVHGIPRQGEPDLLGDVQFEVVRRSKSK
jgi:hypothetical protein